MNVYDFDGTIYDGDSTVDFYLYALKKHPLLLRYLPVQAKGFALYAMKKIDKNCLKQHFYSFLKGVSGEALVESFWDSHQNKIYPWYLQQQKTDDVVISASPDFLLRPICSRLGIACLIASDVDPATGTCLGENCRGQEKVIRFRAEFPETQIQQFYSDSQSDLPMARLARKAFLIEKGKVLPWNTENGTT